MQGITYHDDDMCTFPLVFDGASDRERDEDQSKNLK